MTQPWLPYLATDLIKQLKPQVVFEWGSGESTKFFKELGVGVLTSIEHDLNWYNKLDTDVKPYVNLIPFDNWEIGPDKANPFHYKSGSTELGPVNFKAYATAIEDQGLYDLILIDGMARPSCLYHAFSHVAPGGCIVLDNTNDRPYYLEQTHHLFGDWDSGWEQVKVFGYGPILDYKWETTFFFNRGKNAYSGL